MFFVFFPIDVLFLDKNKKVVELKENFKPFSIYFPKNKAKLQKLNEFYFMLNLIYIGRKGCS